MNKTAYISYSMNCSHLVPDVGTITAIEGTSIAVEFDKVGLKKMGYEFCMEKKMLEFI